MNMQLSAGTVVGDYTLGAVLGRGGSAVVHQAMHRTTGGFVAIKTLKHDSDNGAVVTEIELLHAVAASTHLPTCARNLRYIYIYIYIHITREGGKVWVSRSSKLDHPNIVKYFGVVEEHGEILHVVLEFMENGDTHRDYVFVCVFQDFRRDSSERASVNKSARADPHIFVSGVLKKKKPFRLYTGSLASVRKNFGNFTEPVCAMYMRQARARASSSREKEKEEEEEEEEEEEGGCVCVSCRKALFST